MFCTCLNVVTLTSKNRATQLAKQVSSLLSNAPLLIAPEVKQRFQQRSVM